MGKKILGTILGLLLCTDACLIYASTPLADYFSLHTESEPLLPDSEMGSDALSGLWNLSTIGNQLTVTSVAPVTLNSVIVRYYSDQACLTQTSTLTLAGPANLEGKSYLSSDQSNFALCSSYSGGCASLLTAAKNGTAKAMTFTFNFSGGSVTTSDCMYNSTLGYETLADYTIPSDPVACSSGSRCGYSQSYRTTLGAPIISNNSNFNGYLSAITGSISCWGVGNNGQIGNGANSNVNVPTSVTMPSNVTAFGAVSTNIVFSCAIASQGTNAGKIYCWGTGTSGQIGNGTNSNVNFPTSVTIPNNVTAFGAVSTNDNFSCAIASTGANAGKIYCWGLGTNGQIGNGANSSIVNVPTSVTMPSNVIAFGAVSTNANFSCAIASQGTNAGKIYCWGLGTNGQIGNGANSSTVNVPTSVTMPTGVTAFGAVSTNDNFSCAIASQGTNAGKIYCWGLGTSGQIGNGANSNVNVPTSVIMPSNVTAFGAVSTNTNFSCAIASQGTNAGKIYCWGTGTSGQIGNGANNNVTVPTATN